jgi:hypothetical protein
MRCRFIAPVVAGWLAPPLFAAPAAATPPSQNERAIQLAFS